MKAANKFPPSRQTITLPRSPFDILDNLLRETPNSVFVHELIERENR
jgi:hypothetical protein